MRLLLPNFILLSLLAHVLVAGILLLAPGLHNRQSEFIAVTFFDASAPLSSIRKLAKQFVPKSTAAAIKSEIQSEVIPTSASAETEIPSTDPVSSSGSLITQGVRPINMNEINKSIRRTPEAVQKNIEGNVRLKLLIDDQGVVRKVTPLTHLGFGLDEVAAAAAWKLTFIPARINSKAVALETLYTVKFNLTHQ